MTDQELIEIARALARPRTLKGGSAGDVGCAMLSADGKIYTGVCIDLSCGLGFCAEHSAGAAMLAQGQTQIRRVVAVSDKGAVVPPCGRCREFMRQLDEKNMDAEVILGVGQVARLRELLPHPW